MRFKETNSSINKVETTIGELVEILTVLAEKMTQNEQESYTLTAQAISKILSNNDFTPPKNWLN